MGRNEQVGAGPVEGIVSVEGTQAFSQRAYEHDFTGRHGCPDFSPMYGAERDRPVGVEIIVVSVYRITERATAMNGAWEFVWRFCRHDEAQAGQVLKR